MPVQYEGIRAEHVAGAHGRRACSTSRTWARSRPPGPAPSGSSSTCSPTTSRSWPSGGAQYSVLCREDGGVLDDLFTYRLPAERFLTVTNAANHEKDLAWFREHADGFEVEVHDAPRRLGDAGRPGSRPRAASLASIAERRAAGADAHRRARAGRRAGAGLRHRLHGRGRLRAAAAARRRRRRLGRPARARRDAGRPGRARHAAPRGLLPPLRQRPVRGPQPDRGGPGLVLQARHGLHRRRGAGRRSSPTERLVPFAFTGPGIPRQGNPVAAPHGAGRGDQRHALALPRDRHRDGATCRSRTPRRVRRSRWTCAARRAPAEVRGHKARSTERTDSG